MTEAQAVHLGITEETAANLSDFILYSAEVFLAAADDRLTDPNAATEEAMQRAVDQMNAGISVQEGALAMSSLAQYEYTDQDGNQHLWFTPEDLVPNERHLTDTEQGTTAAFPEVTGDGAGASDLTMSNDFTSVITAQQARSIGPRHVHAPIDGVVRRLTGVALANTKLRSIAPLQLIQTNRGAYGDTGLHRDSDNAVPIILTGANTFLVHEPGVPTGVPPHLVP